MVWLVAAGGFALHVANFSNYGKTYGNLAAVIVLLIWMWISNIAILLVPSSTPSCSAIGQSKPATLPTTSPT